MADFAHGKMQNKNGKITIINMKEYMFNQDLKLSEDFETKINDKIKEMYDIIEDKIKPSRADITNEPKFLKVIQNI